ncbi:hypothetical protein BDR04DRAFT_1154135 [Suillus decipiens]|nr:hypothetical protein BDR04DRAFT_1154135 [Suillus decipiens]
MPIELSVLKRLFISGTRFQKYTFKLLYHNYQPSILRIIQLLFQKKSPRSSNPYPRLVKRLYPEKDLCSRLFAQPVVEIRLSQPTPFLYFPTFAPVQKLSSVESVDIGKYSLDKDVSVAWQHLRVLKFAIEVFNDCDINAFISVKVQVAACPAVNVRCHTFSDTFLCAG